MFPRHGGELNADTCAFCTIIAGHDPDVREVYRNDHVVAFHPTEPATLGHTLVVPHRHVENVWDLAAEEANHLSQAVLLLSDAVRAAVHPEGLNIIQSNGEAATQTIPHLHVHLVPRFADDSMGDIWPVSTNFSEQKKDEVQSAIQRSVRTNPRFFDIPPNPEDRRKHLDLIQAVIARQSAASASAKSWLLPIITATFGFALTQESWQLGLIGAVVISLFAFLDVSYLHSEQMFRKLYAEVIRPGNQVPLYSLDPMHTNLPTTKEAATSQKKGRRPFLPPWPVWWSWSIAPFYTALLAVSLVVIFAASGSNEAEETGQSDTVHVLIERSNP
ncbi:HIT family protein [Corynebacterium efficiens]|nr:HIT family protein [Corynebacterium efficiens]